MSADPKPGSVEAVLGRDLWESVQCVEALSESEKALAKFEQTISRRIKQVTDDLNRDIEAGLKAVEKETGYDWEPYLDDFNVYDWKPGDFQRHIADWLKAELQDASEHKP